MSHKTPDNPRTKVEQRQFYAFVTRRLDSVVTCLSNS
jgi:hypothetical protein